MSGNKAGAVKKMATELKKYGSKEALSAEMSRRAKLVKHRPGGGFRGNPELARQAREKRRQNEARVKRPRPSQATQADNGVEAGNRQTEEAQD